MATSMIVFACLFGGALLGMFLRSALPEDHLSKDSKDLAMNIVVGLTAVMAALVLGLMISSAQDSFKTKRSEIIQLSAKIISLDRTLVNYGPETKEARELLCSGVVLMLNQMWPEDSSQPSQLGTTVSQAEVLLDKIGALLPQNETQRLLKAQAFSIASNFVQTRWLMFEQEVRLIPGTFLLVVAVMVFWLTSIFFIFGLFAPSNATIMTILVISALSISVTFFLIVELNRPFDGLLRIPSEPLRDALLHLGQ
jgi:hypothetical protein